MLGTLNRTFGIAGRIEFETGPGGLTIAKLTHRSGAVLVATLYGAHVLSWKDRFGKERLFLSNRAAYQPGKAIRGGIPIIFPQFGPGPLPTHGFARTSQWEIAETRELADGSLVLRLALTSSAETRNLWPHEFRAVFEVVLQDALFTSLAVENTGVAQFAFQNAFHTYFPVSDIAQIAVSGMGGLEYLDNLQGKARVREESQMVVIDREVDRVYLQAPRILGIEDAGAGRSVQIDKDNLSDAVVWNPWIEKSKTLSDLAPEDFKRFVCVETGNIGSPVEVPPKSSFVCGQTIR